MQKQTIITGAAALVTAGALAFGGAALAQAGPTNAGVQSLAQDTSTPTPTADADAKGQGRGPAGAPGQRTKEAMKDRLIAHGLAGDTAVKVTQAAVAKEPTAYLLRVGKAHDGTYRAHMVRPDFTRIILTIDANYAVTSVEEAPVKAPGPRGPKAGKEAPSASTPTATS